MNVTTTAGSPPGAGLPGGARGPVSLTARRRPGEALIRASLLASAALSVAITIGIILALLEPVLHFFRRIPVSDFFATEGEFAVIPLVTATLMVTILALLVAVPLGLGAAMYLSEYASPKRTGNRSCWRRNGPPRRGI